VVFLKVMVKVTRVIGIKEIDLSVLVIRVVKFIMMVRVIKVILVKVIEATVKVTKVIGVVISIIIVEVIEVSTEVKVIGVIISPGGMEQRRQDVDDMHEEWGEARGSLEARGPQEAGAADATLPTRVLHAPGTK
jgi:hypothetical protein